MPAGSELVVMDGAGFTVTLAVALETNWPEAVMMDEPWATPVMGTVTEVAPEPKDTVVGTVASAGVPELRVICRPPVGAGAERSKLTF